MMRRNRSWSWTLAWLPALLCAPAMAQAPAQTPVRQQQLLRMLQQDCGSCHGMRLTGGLGPPIHAQAMRELPRTSIAAVIYHGRPGTPMPPWKSMLSAAEAEWLAGVLRGEEETKP